MNLRLLTITLITTLSFNISSQCQKTDSTRGEINISLEKEILTSLEASLGTISIAKIDSFLILHDSHVSDRKLICIDYTSGKEHWKIETDVHRFYIYKDKVIINFDKDIAAYQVETGEELWRIKSVYISYNNPNASNVSENLLAYHNDKKVILNLETQSLESFKEGIVETHHFQLNANQVIKSRIGVKNTYNYKGKLLAVIIINDSLGMQRDYVWSLDEETRKYYLKGFDSNKQVISDSSWKMDEGKRLAKDFFNGNPEPEKLESSVFFIDGRLFLFENYVLYRWSWNRGNNRISSIDWKTGEIVYQKWGQAPEETEFNTFQFFDNVILYSDNVMHFQNGDGSFCKFDSQNGEFLDSLPQKTTLFTDYNENHLLGFSYERKQVIESKYTNAIEMKLWNIDNNTFSETFRFDYNKDYPYKAIVFSKEGLVIIYFYLEAKNKNMLRCYRIKKTN